VTTAKPTVLKSWDTLREKATGNYAIDRDAYVMVPHLLFNLAVAYTVPDELILTVLFLWDKTVGEDIDVPIGNCALSQIPVRERNARRWLAALVAVGFWNCKKSGYGDAKGSLYEYKNPTAEEWEDFFRAASVSRNFAGFDDIDPKRFGDIFARALGRPVPIVEQPQPSEAAVAARKKLIMGRGR
jgi:hypothetical protein